MNTEIVYIEGTRGPDIIRVNYICILETIHENVNSIQWMDLHCVLETKLEQVYFILLRNSKVRGNYIRILETIHGHRDAIQRRSRHLSDRHIDRTVIYAFLKYY